MKLIDRPVYLSQLEGIMNTPDMTFLGGCLEGVCNLKGLLEEVEGDHCVADGASLTGEVKNSR